MKPVVLEESKLLKESYKKYNIFATSSLISFIAGLTNGYLKEEIPIPIIGTTSYNLFHIMETIRIMERKFNVKNSPIILVSKKDFTQEEKEFFEKVSPIFVVKQSSAPTPDKLVEKIEQILGNIIG